MTADEMWRRLIARYPNAALLTVDPEAKRIVGEAARDGLSTDLLVARLASEGVVEPPEARPETVSETGLLVWTTRCLAVVVLFVSAFLGDRDLVLAAGFCFVGLCCLR